MRQVWRKAQLEVHSNGRDAMVIGVQRAVHAPLLGAEPNGSEGHGPAQPSAPMSKSNSDIMQVAMPVAPMPKAACRGDRKVVRSAHEEDPLPREPLLAEHVGLPVLHGLLAVEGLPDDAAPVPFISRAP